MDNPEFILLCSRAWAIPILAVMKRHGLGRVSPIASAIGAGRTAATASVLHLIEIGLVERNAGHGHPLRPEIILTERGHEIAEWSVDLMQSVEAFESPKLLSKSWTLPILRSSEQDGQYASLRRSLSPITDRALSLSLKALTSEGWLKRQVNVQEIPPSVHYELAGDATKLIPSLAKSWTMAA